MTLQDDGYNQKTLTDRMRTKWAGRTVFFYEETDSTNVRAKIEAEAGAKHGTIVVADRQTAGRGRRGRSWTNPAGMNIAFTLILKPDFIPAKASMLTLLMALAVAQGVEKTLRESDGAQQIVADLLRQKAYHLAQEEQSENEARKDRRLKSGIKWPNDIVVNGRKICGILTEMSMEKDRIKHVLIGVGINVGRQEFAPELVDKATSIENECGFRVSRGELVVNIMNAFENVYAVFVQDGNLSGLRDAYEGLLVNRGREVCVLDSRGEYRGTALGITDTGELLVRRQDGRVEEVYAGEVSVRGVYGYV